MEECDLKTAVKSHAQFICSRPVVFQRQGIRFTNGTDYKAESLHCEADPSSVSGRRPVEKFSAANGISEESCTLSSGQK